MRGIGVCAAAVMAAAALAAALCGCAPLGRGRANRVTALLEEKYGQPFSAEAIGHSYGYASSKLYVYADEDPTLVFVVRLDGDGEIEFEDYAYRKLCRRVDGVVEGIFADYGMEVVCYAGTFGVSYTTVESPDVLLGDYIERFKPEAFTASIAIAAEAVRTDELKRIYKDVYAALGDTAFGTDILFLSPADYEIAETNGRRDTQAFTADRLKMVGAADEIRNVYFKYDGETFSSSNADVDAEVLP